MNRERGQREGRKRASAKRRMRGIEREGDTEGEMESQDRKGHQGLYPAHFHIGQTPA